jgi:hypothetical protein
VHFVVCGSEQVVKKLQAYMQMIFMVVPFVV